MSVSLSWSAYARLAKERCVRLDADERETVQALGAVILASPTSSRPAVSKLIDLVSGTVEYAALLREEVVLCPTLEEACKRYTDATRMWVEDGWVVTEYDRKEPFGPAVELEARRDFAGKRYALRRVFPVEEWDTMGAAKMREWFTRKAHYEWAKALEDVRKNHPP